MKSDLFVIEVLRECASFAEDIFCMRYKRQSISLKQGLSLRKI